MSTDASAPVRASPLLVGGLEPFTTIDFPGFLAAVVFLQGCPWRCPYCHNAHLRPFRCEKPLPWLDVMDFLTSRQGFLEGVVFSGGEPTAQAGLSRAMRDVRALGYRVGLHTAGIYPHRLARVLGLVDWVGLDVKAPLDDRCDLISGIRGSAARVSRSLDLVLASGVPLQIRTTVDPSLLSKTDISDLAEDLRWRGAPPTILQKKISISG